jgi:hypothetical protein
VKKRHNFQTTFRLDCFNNENSDSVKVSVYTNVSECVHPSKKTRELSGVARELLKEKLKHTSATLVRIECVKKCDPVGIKLNNIQDAKSYSVLRKAKSEALAEDDLHEDCLTDLFMMRDQQRDPQLRYIQHVAHPFEVIIYSRDVLYVACMAKDKAKYNKTDFIMHVDATGKVVRPIEQCEGKRVLYYSMIFQFDNNILPLSEFTTCKHNALSIGTWLLKLKEFLVNENKWPICNRVVTDFSWAIIVAVIVQWNKMDLMTYLIHCHDFAHQGKLHRSVTVTLHIC